MNKSELISAVAAEAGLSKVDAKKAIEAFVSTVTNTLAIKLLLSVSELSL